MAKLTICTLLLTVPTFLVLISVAVFDLVQERTGYSHKMKEMELTFPSFTICPVEYSKNPLDPGEPFDAWKKNTGLPMKINSYLGFSFLHKAKYVNKIHSMFSAHCHTYDT